MVTIPTAGLGLVSAASSQAAGTLTVTLSPPLIAANGVSTTDASVTGADPGDTVTFSSTGGNTVTPTGPQTATIKSTTTAGKVTINATAAPSGATGSATLTQYGPATSVTVSLAPSVIQANGSSTVATATVKDSAGDPVPNDSIGFTAGLGDTVSAVTNNHDGTYSATITSSSSPGQAQVTATDTSVAPNVSGGAVLTQQGPASGVTVTLSPISIAANGSSTTTATATIQDAGGNPLPNDIVVFSSSDPGDKVSATSSLGNGTYTAVITSSTTAGLVTIRATDTSRTPNLQGTATLTQTAGAPTTMTLKLAPASIPANGSTTSVATATVTDANGNIVRGQEVLFSSSDNGDKVSGTTPNADGTYSATITSSTHAHTATIGAADVTIAPFLTASAQLIETAGGTGLSLVASPSAPVTNQGVTLFAAITTSTGSPSGTITFEEGGVRLADCQRKTVSAANPTATCETSFSSAGSPHRLTAVFAPDGSSTAPGSTGVALLNVGKDSTTTSVDVSNLTVQTGKNVTYTATVTPGHAGPVQPSGSVEFFDGQKPISGCTSQPLAQVNGFVAATCTLSYATPGTHAIAAAYLGDSNFLASGSQPQTVKVQAGKPLGTISATMQWSFFYTPSYTKVLAMLVHKAPVGATVSVSCSGQGCPFSTVSSNVVKPKPCTSKGKTHACRTPDPGTVHLGSRFGTRHLPVGTQITVQIVRPGWVGKFYRFTVRSGKGPAVTIKCLAPGSSRPGAGC